MGSGTKLSQFLRDFLPTLGKVLLKNKRFQADGQNIAQNCTTMRVVEITLECSRPRKKICNRSSVRKLRLQ